MAMQSMFIHYANDKGNRTKEIMQTQYKQAFSCKFQILKFLTRAKQTVTRHLLALQVLLVDAECLLEELLLFLEMDGLETGGHGSTRRATRVEDVAAVVVLGGIEQSFNARLRVAPGTRVQRLLLAPYNVTSVGVAVQVLLELGPREGVQLLDTGDGGVADVVGVTVLGESGVDLARAEDHTLNLLGLIDGTAVGRVGDNPLEVRVTSEVLDVRAGDRVTQKRLREEDNKSCSMLARVSCRNSNIHTFTELTVDLATQDMEQVGGSSHVGNLHVDVLVGAIELVLRWEDARLLVTELQPTLHPTGRVLRTLSIVTMRQ